ncbi:MAG: PepSY domain-containing protein [Rhodobacteraceae bacterium]|nr:PepSY domain-containing protein [Paracoccaceae bacterium]
MKTKFFHAAAMLLMSTTLSHAAITSDDLISQYQAQGYTRIEIKVGTTLAKVEAIKDGQKVEVLYDLVTGAVLKTETEAVDAGDNVTPGVQVRNVRDEKLDDDRGGDDDSDDDSDNDSDDDDSSDDDSSDDGDDDSGDDDGDDDNSGDDDDDDDGDDSDGDDD